MLDSHVETPQASCFVEARRLGSVQTWHVSPWLRSGYFRLAIVVVIIGTVQPREGKALIIHHNSAFEKFIFHKVVDLKQREASPLSKLVKPRGSLFY